MNGKSFVRDLDLFEAAGCNAALILEKVFVLSSNEVQLVFTSSVENPMISFIQIKTLGSVPTMSPTSTPASLVPIYPEVIFIHDAKDDTPFVIGNTWSYYSSSSVGGNYQGLDARDFRSHRSGQSGFSYTIDTPLLQDGGKYLVRLGFAEVHKGNCAQGERIFSVLLNGKSIVSGLDVFDRVGCYTALVLEKELVLSGSQIELAFIAVKENPMVSVIEVRGQQMSSPPPSILSSGVPSSEPTTPPSAFPVSIPTEAPTGKGSGAAPSKQPSVTPSLKAFGEPSSQPSLKPTAKRSHVPSMGPSGAGSAEPSIGSSQAPSSDPSAAPSILPTEKPSHVPSVSPSGEGSAVPSIESSQAPSSNPSAAPSILPSAIPTVGPSLLPTTSPSSVPSLGSSQKISTEPTMKGSILPSSSPSSLPSNVPSIVPSTGPTILPSSSPSSRPSDAPSTLPSVGPSIIPSGSPSMAPTSSPYPTLSLAQQNGQVTCVSVIDENNSRNVDSHWAAFRSKFPNRPFCVLRPIPAGTSSGLVLPTGYTQSPASNIFAEVTRDSADADPSRRSDWFTTCNLAASRQQGLHKVVLFVDNSGSMYTSSVQNAFDAFHTQVEANGMEVVTAVYNSNEDYIDPCFQTDLLPTQSLVPSSSGASTVPSIVPSSIPSRSQPSASPHDSSLVPSLFPFDSSVPSIVPSILPSTPEPTLNPFSILCDYFQTRARYSQIAPSVVFEYDGIIYAPDPNDPTKILLENPTPKGLNRYSSIHPFIYHKNFPDFRPRSRCINYTPLLLDLNGDESLNRISGSFELTLPDRSPLPEEPVKFNEWIGPDDGILVAYRGRYWQYFHEDYSPIGIQPAGAPDGTYIAGAWSLYMREYVESCEGIGALDEHDLWAVWRDKNSNLKVDEGEISSLASNGIATISRDYTVIRDDGTVMKVEAL